MYLDVVMRLLPYAGLPCPTTASRGGGGASSWLAFRLPVLLRRDRRVCVVDAMDGADSGRWFPPALRGNDP